MLPSLLLALAQESRPAELAPVQSLVRVPRGALTLDVVRAFELDVAAVRRTGEVDVIVDAAERAGLVRAGVPFTVVHEDLVAFYASRLDRREALRGTPPLGAWLSPQFGAGAIGGYYSYAEVVSVLDQIHAAYPALTTAKFSVGTTHEGRTLWALKVSDNPDVDEGEPEARFDAMHHAREPQSMQSTLWLLLALLERHGTDPLATYLVDEREIWFVPCVNPDGYVYNQTIAPGGGGLWRLNRRNNGGGSFGVDLNRNYSFQWGFDSVGSSPSPGSETYRGPSPASEPEISAMQAFFTGRDFSVAISAHTYSDLWLWPWGYTAAGPANNAQYVEVGDLCTLETGWVRGPAGATLYLANGVTNDYDHGTHGTMSFTPEIGGDEDGFWPPTSRIVPLAEETEPGFLRAAWAAGAYVHRSSQAASEVGDSDGAFEPGEGFRLVLTLRNSGRVASGPVELELSSTTPGITATTGFVALGSVASFASASNAGQPLELAIGAGVPVGTQVQYVATVRYEGFEQTFPGSFAVGVARTILADDLELNLGWTTGLPGDAATSGLWAYGNPLGTTNGGDPCNPEDDATPGAGVRCFATGNGSTTAGTDDVDGGPTTLLSPRLDLSGVTAAALRYRRWFANFTTINDTLEVALSDDDGATWTPVETVSGSLANAWNDHEVAVQDFVALTDRVRIRFRTGDVPNDSLTEAAVDELSVVTFETGPKVNFYGRRVIGTQLAMHVAVDPSQGWVLRASPGTASIPTPFGLVLIQPSGAFTLATGTAPASGLSRIVATLPNTPGLVGLTVYAQAFTTGPIALSNRAELTFQ